MTQQKLIPVHPGEVLMEEFLKPMGISQNKLARAISVPPRRINEIVLEKRSVSADTALRLAQYFGTSAKFWMGLQIFPYSCFWIVARSPRPIREHVCGHIFDYSIEHYAIIVFAGERHVALRLQVRQAHGRMIAVETI